MKFSRRSSRDRFRAIDITSMIDVVFLLIIFFMTTAQFARLTREEIDLPIEPGEQEKEPEEAGVVINLTREGTLIVAGETVDLDGLERVVRAEIRQHPSLGERGAKLMIRADRHADTRHLNAVIARLRGLGVGAARMATEVPR